ncbi:MAG: hypothetical protein ABSA57_09740 [Candidatus Acidiferrales bacterium]
MFQWRRRAENPQLAPADAPAAEPHPEIRDAIESLRNARLRLLRAVHDFGGHRAADDAIRLLEICLPYDR